MRNSNNLPKYLGTKILQILKWFFFLIIYLFSSSIISLAGMFNKQIRLEERTLGIGLITCAVTLAFIGWRYFTQLKEHNPKKFGKHPITGKKVFFVVVLFATMLLIQFVWSYLIQVKIINFPTNQTEVEQSALLMPIWSAVFAIFIAPVFEEFIFRGIFMNYFFNKNTRLNNFLAVFISGTIFGLAHEPSLDLNLLMYSSLGWVLGFSYIYFRDIRFNILLHFLNNLMSVI